MSVSRAALAGGPAHINFKSINLHLSSDGRLSVEPATQDVASSMYGTIDESVEDLVIKASGTPVGEYKTADLAVLLPYLGAAIGGRCFGDSDAPLKYLSNNGDVFTLKAAAVTKMPSLYLGVDKPILGDVEFSGILADGANPEDADSYYTIQTGQVYTPVAIDKSKIKQQRYSAAWGAVTGFTAFQAQEGWTIDWELKLEPVKIQARTVDMKFLGLKAMAKCSPLGPTAAQIAAAQKVQGTGSASGSRLGASAFDLVITGSGVSVTVKNAALKTAGFVFGGKPLRNGEIGFVSTIDVSSGTASAVAVLE